MGNRASRPQPGACYFTRDLEVGSYGGDVFCLQEHLTSRGLLGGATGYYGENTLAAVKKWQRRHGVKSDEPGVLGAGSREAYAKEQKLPSLGGAPTGNEQRGTVRKVQTCSELAGKRHCATAHSRDPREVPHACRQACQQSFADVCTKVYPAWDPQGPVNFKKCMQFMHSSCDMTCATVEGGPTST